MIWSDSECFICLNSPTPKYIQNLTESCLFIYEDHIIKHAVWFFFTGSDTNSWTEVTLPQLSVPRAGHSIITMQTGGHHLFSEVDEGVDADSGSRTLLVFGGGDNEGNFYSDLTIVAVEELLTAI